MKFRTGQGWDSHSIAPGRLLVLGGITVPSDYGLEGHSDADVLSHAITDALLGAIAAGDIGMHFSDTDPRWRGADSVALGPGSADPFGTLDELRPHFALIPAPTRLIPVEGAGHDLKRGRFDLAAMVSALLQTNR